MKRWLVLGIRLASGLIATSAQGDNRTEIPCFANGTLQVKRVRADRIVQIAYANTEFFKKFKAVRFFP